MRKPGRVRMLSTWILFGILVGMVPALAETGSVESPLQIGSVAPQFQVKDLSGEVFDLGKVLTEQKAVVLNFWGLRCQSCLQEIPHLDALYKQRKADGLSILGINVDGVGPEVIRSNLPRVIEMPAYLLAPDENFVVSDLYKMSAAPLTIVLGSGGKISFIHEGYEPGDEKELEKRVQDLLQ